MALHAVIAVHASVQFIDPSGTGLLMQTVDILRDNRLETAFLLHFCELEMGAVGLGFQRKHFIPVEAVEFLRTLHKEGMR